jgi:DNA-directed RNA polymerase specialized sigma24 family protein
MKESDFSQDDYDKVMKIARKACKKIQLTPDEWEEVKQEAALVAWKTNFKSATRIWYTAYETALKCKGWYRVRREDQRTYVEYEDRSPARDNTEEEATSQVYVESLLATLPPKFRASVEKTIIEGHLLRELGDDGTVSRHRKIGLEMLKARTDLL